VRGAHACAEVIVKTSRNVEFGHGGKEEVEKQMSIGRFEVLKSGRAGLHHRNLCPVPHIPSVNKRLSRSR
jgi:hypothetical protein